MRFGREVKKLRPLPEPSLPGAGTVVGLGMDWSGDLMAAEDVVVFGALVGNIETSCQVRVERSGRVRGRISAASAIIEGRVEGDVAAAQKIQVAATGKVKGDLEARSVALAEGARVGGRIRTLECEGASGSEEAQGS